MAGVIDRMASDASMRPNRLRNASALRFRNEERSLLVESGFAVDHVYGGWLGEPVGAGDGELVVVARA
jgi:hypothetical protein